MQKMYIIFGLMFLFSTAHADVRGEFDSRSGQRARADGQQSLSGEVNSFKRANVTFENLVSRFISKQGGGSELEFSGQELEASAQSMMKWKNDNDTHPISVSGWSCIESGATRLLANDDLNGLKATKSSYGFKAFWVHTATFRLRNGKVCQADAIGIDDAAEVECLDARSRRSVYKLASHHIAPNCWDWRDQSIYY